MTKFNHKVPGVLSVFELRDLGFELTSTPETAFGMTKSKKDKTKVVHVMPPDFVIDRFNFTTIDISHVEQKKKVH